MSMENRVVAFGLLIVCLALVFILPIQPDAKLPFGTQLLEETIQGVAHAQTPANVKQNARTVDVQVATDKNQKSPADARPTGRSLTREENVVRNFDLNDRKDLEFDRQAKQLAMRLRTANLDDQAKVRQQLEALNDMHFEYRQQQRKQEIERLSARVDALRVLQTRRQQNKAEVLKRRMTELTDPNADLSWSDDEIHREASLADTQLSEQARSEPKRAENAGAVPLANPTYQGKSFDQWFSILETERSPEKLGEAVDALKYLADVNDPHRLVQAIFRMNRLRNGNVHEQRGMGGDPAAMVVHKSVALMFEMPAKVVVEELIAELEGPNPPGRGIQLLTKYMIRTCAQMKGYLPDSYLDQVTALRAEIVRRSRRILMLLATVHGRNESLDDWIIECAHNILELNGQRLTAFPNLIPVAERVLSEPGFQEKDSAADLLGQSGLQAAEVLAFSENELNTIPFTGNYEPQLKRVCRRIAGLYAVAPEGVLKIFDNQWNAYETPPWGRHSGQVVAIIDQLIIAIGEVGPPAKEIVPYLRAKSESPQCPKEISNKIPAAITAIETAKPKPEPPPLPEDNEASANEAQPTSSASTTLRDENSANSSRGPTSGSREVEEQTFDGVPYSKWLKMLETEHKPEKLAMAFDACSRLANSGDEHRIIRQIFLGAALFETGDPTEQQNVWDSANQALKRMSAAVVVDELVRALQEKKDFASGRRFQAEFIVLHLTDSMKELVKERSSEIVRDLVSLAETIGKDADVIIAAASNVWIYSERPLDDFGRLKELSIKLVDEGTIVPASLRKKQPSQAGVMGTAVFGPIVNFFAWQTVAWNLVRSAPDTPDLAKLLVKHTKSQSSATAFSMLGAMGRHAEPAVPLLVDRFVETWTVVEQNAKRPRRGGNMDTVTPAVQTCRSIVWVIGEVGVGDEGFELLRELKMMAVPADFLSDNERALFAAVEKGLKRFPHHQRAGEPILFAKDKNKIQGYWRIRSGHQVAVIEDSRIRFRDRPKNNVPRPASPPTSFEIDETKTPKQITFGDDGTGLQRGIYELSETTLRIQIAKEGAEPPTEFVKETADLPNNQILWEFERELAPFSDGQE